jgi:hypothetical protein
MSHRDQLSGDQRPSYLRLRSTRLMLGAIGSVAIGLVLGSVGHGIRAAFVIVGGVADIALGLLLAADSEEWEAQTRRFLAFNGIRSTSRASRAVNGIATVTVSVGLIVWAVVTL